MLMDTGLMVLLRRLRLTPTAIEVLSVMVEKQEPGGAVLMTQTEIASELGVDRTRVSRAMRLLVERGVVVRPNGVGRRYSLNPTVAGYDSEHDMEKEMTRQLAAGGPPPIMVPKYQQAPPKAGHGHLSSVA
jgi:predicted transcriptional regulator